MEEDQVSYVCVVVGFSVGEYYPLSFILLSLWIGSGKHIQGVYTNGAVQLGKIMDSAAFKVWSTALLILLLVMWFVIQIFTVKGIITGEILGLSRGWRWKYLTEPGDEDGEKQA